MTKISQPMWPSSLQVPRTPRPGMESADSRRLATKHSRKALKASLTLGILLGMFFVTWLPFFVANIAQVKKMTCLTVQGGGRRMAHVWYLCLSARSTPARGGSLGPCPGPGVTNPIPTGRV